MTLGTCAHAAAAKLGQVLRPRRAAAGRPLPLGRSAGAQPRTLTQPYVDGGLRLQRPANDLDR